jgi:hypothetical protein
MALNKKSFVLYTDQRSYFDKLNDQEAGQLIKHIFSYVNDENPNPVDRIIDLSFEPIKLQLKRDLVKYESISNRNKSNGKLGGRPKQEEQEEPKKPTGLSGNPTEPKKADTDNDTDNDINNSLFDSVFDSFLVMRKQLKKPMTGKAIELLKSKLEKLAPADEQTQIEILEQSIMNNWQGVFPLKDSAKKEGANGILLKDCDIDILPIKDIHRVKYRAVVGFYVLFTDIAKRIKRNDNLDLLNSADLGVWMYDIDQIEKEHEFDTFKLFTIGVYLKEILYDDQLHFDIDSITSLKDLYGRYSNGKSKFLRVSRDADKYIDKFDMWQKVRTANEFING